MKLLLDSNVIVAAIKNPLKETVTLRLLIKLLSSDIQLIGNKYLALRVW